MNELLWVAAKRTFTIPGPWPLVRLVSGVVNELLRGGGQKNVHRPWPLAPLFAQLTVRVSIFTYHERRSGPSHTDM